MTIDSPARILVEAERLFADGGFAGTSLSSIARAAGLGNAGLLHHFPSKAALYRAVLESISEDVETRNGVVLARAGGPVTRLRGLVDALLSLGRERPTAMMIIAQEFLDRSGRIEEAGTLPLSRVVRDTAAVIEAGQSEGAVRPGDPVAMTAALHGALLQGVLARTVYTRTADRDTDDEAWVATIAASALAGALVDGVAAPS